MSESHQINTKYFKELDLYWLKIYAKRWVEQFPNVPIDNIALYRYRIPTPNLPTKFAVVFKVHLSKSEAELSEDYKKFESALINLHTMPYDEYRAHALDLSDFDKVYDTKPSVDFLKEWKFLIHFYQQKLPSSVRAKEPYMVLYPDVEDVDFYNITEGNLDAGPNYNLIFSTEVKQFEIMKASLTLQALNLYTDFGTDPVYEYSLSGFVLGDDESSVFGVEEVQFTLDPSAITGSGEYVISPYLSEPMNYYLVITNGYLYVNEVGNGLKKIRTYLDCVTDSGDPEYPLIARFFYENTNDFPIYIEPGEPGLSDNYLLSEGQYQLIPGQPIPHVFEPGGGTFDVMFDGNKLTWVVISFDSNSGHKTSVSTDASLASARCSSGARIADASLGGANTESMEDELSSGSIVVYPNPVKDKFIIRFAGEQENVLDVFLFDSQGKYHTLKGHWITSESGYEVDLSQMNS